MMREPTTLPLRSISWPFALSGKATCAIPVITSGYTMPRISVVTIVIRTAAVRFFPMFMMFLHRRRGRSEVRFLREMQCRDDDVDDLDADERRDDATDAVDQQVA